MNIQALLSAAAATPFPSIPPHPHPVDHDENRGTKRKLSGWTAPPHPHHTAPLHVVQQDETVLKSEHVNVKAESPPVKPEEPSAASSASSYARFGTRVPGSGDLGNTGPVERTWPLFPGVNVGQRTEAEAEEVVVLEEECYSWLDLPMNKQGFRYIACGPSPIPSPNAAHPFYRRIPALRAPFGHDTPIETAAAAANASPGVHLDWLDRSLYLKLSPSALTCTTEKGFRSARGNCPVRAGAWYFECLILKGGGQGKSVRPGEKQVVGVTSERFRSGGGGGKGASDGAHVRIGWARREAPLNGPCGLDAYSYGIRDATGEKVTLSRPKEYADDGFGTGDVVGCLISLPPRPREPGGPPVKRKRIPIRYKGQLYFESMEYTVPKEMEALVARDGRLAAAAEADTSATAIGQAAAPGKGKSEKGKGKIKTQAGKAVRKKANGRRRPDDRDYGSDSDIDAAPKPRALPRLAGSKISFFLNGKPMAPSAAFEDIFDFLPLKQTEAELAAQAALIKKLGALEASLKDRENPNDDGTLGYYPFISCFGTGKVQFNPGPEWMAPVDPTAWGLGLRSVDGREEPITPRPMSERWAEFAAEETQYDRADEDELTELLRKERAAEGKKRVKTQGGSSKKSTSKKPSVAAAVQASKPVSRDSSAVPSVNGAQAGSRPSAFLATMIQDRGTPGGTPAPDTPGLAAFPTQTIMPDPSPAAAVTSAAPQPYPDYRRENTVSATSEDALGEDDWSPAVEGPPPAVRVASDGPELPYGMEQ
ncbi:transcription factor, contains a PHD finger motif [Naganishia albida]|nr:transcription factor, contains a PHD finger motif [Naganishia albida]